MIHGGKSFRKEYRQSKLYADRQWKKQCTYHCFVLQQELFNSLFLPQVCKYFNKKIEECQKITWKRKIR